MSNIIPKDPYRAILYPDMPQNAVIVYACNGCNAHSDTDPDSAAPRAQVGVRCWGCLKKDLGETPASEVHTRLSLPAGPFSSLGATFGGQFPGDLSPEAGPMTYKPVPIERILLQSARKRKVVVDPGYGAEPVEFTKDDYPKMIEVLRSTCFDLEAKLDRGKVRGDALKRENASLKEAMGGVEPGMTKANYLKEIEQFNSRVDDLESELKLAEVKEGDLTRELELQKFVLQGSIESSTYRMNKLLSRFSKTKVTEVILKQENADLVTRLKAQEDKTREAMVQLKEERGWEFIESPEDATTRDDAERRHRDQNKDIASIIKLLDSMLVSTDDVPKHSKADPTSDLEQELDRILGKADDNPGQ